MYHNTQIMPLLQLLEDLNNSCSTEGCSDNLGVIDASILEKAMEIVEKLKSIKQTVVMGSHEHRHGTSSYLFLCPEAERLTMSMFERLLEEDFEPQHDESLSLVNIGEAKLIDWPIEKLLDVGYAVSLTDEPGKWKWSTKAATSHCNFDTADEAIENAWEHAQKVGLIPADAVI